MSYRLSLNFEVNFSKNLTINLCYEFSHQYVNVVYVYRYQMIFLFADIGDIYIIKKI